MKYWFGEALVGWYKSNKRDLPWRNETDPYKIWLSEIILQQTQVSQGLGYYLKFIEKYPSVSDLAKANEDEVLKLWQGLGYYSRARNLLESARLVHKKYKGVFPDSYNEIRSLKGVGEYTAAAVASFAYNLPYAVVDGNVYRVLSRVFGLDTPIDSGLGKKSFQELADSLLHKSDPAIYNQAIMEFGARFCTHLKADCENCILKKKCVAFSTGKTAVLPVKLKMKKVKTRFFNYLVVADKNKNILVHKRHEKDIWKGLYEFMLIETEKEMAPERLLKSKQVKAICGTGFDLLHQSKKYKHLLTHQHLQAKFLVVSNKKAFKDEKSKINLKKLDNLAFPRLIEKFLNDCDLREIL